MTTLIRRGIMLTLSILVALASMFGVAAAQEPTCYPVPPGGCEEEPPPAPTCDDIIAAIAAGDTDLDQNGDGAIDAGDLPADCGCAALIAAVAAGTLDASALPSTCTCDEIQAAVDAGDLDESALPSDCNQPTTPVSSGTEDNQLAATGIESGPMALLALAGLFGGALLVAVNRRSVKA